MFEKGYLSLGLRMVLAHPVPFFAGGTLLILITIVSFGILTGPCLLGFARMVQRGLRGEEVALPHAFSGFEEGVGSALLAGIVYIILAAAGLRTLFLILPGFVIGAVLIWMFPILADKPGTNLARAFMGSLEFVEEDAVVRLLFGTILLILGSLGALALGIGVFFTMPWALATLFIAYFRTVHPQEEIRLPEKPPTL